MAKGDQLAIREKETTLDEVKKARIPLPKAIHTHLNEKDPKMIKLRSGESKRDVDYGDGRGSRVRVCGRTHRLRSQKGIMFLKLNDEYGLLQYVLTGQLVQTHEAMTLTLETAIGIYVEMWEVPPKQHAPDDRELQYMQTISRSLEKLLGTKMLLPPK